jgi:hypothetical protein
MQYSKVVKENQEKTGLGGCSHGRRVVSFVMEIEATFICLYCLQVNTTLVDASGGMRQEYIEDCQVCCRPNLLRVTVDPSLEEADIEAETP